MSGNEREEWRQVTTVIGGDRVLCIVEGSKTPDCVANDDGSLIYVRCGPVSREDLKKITRRHNASLSALRQRLTKEQPKDLK